MRKTYRHLKPNKKALEKKDRQIRTEYMRKARKLDEKYAGEEGANSLKKASKLLIRADGEVNDEIYNIERLYRNSRSKFRCGKNASNK